MASAARVAAIADPVHGIASLAACLAVVRSFDNRATLASIRCPMFLAWEESNASAAAEEVDSLLTCPHTLVCSSPARVPAATAQ